MKNKTHTILLLIAILCTLVFPAYAAGSATPEGGRTINITLDGTQTIIATLMDTPAAEEFYALLPLTLDTHEHLDRQKEVYLPFSLSEESQQYTVNEYEVGDIVYWHPGPTMGIFHSHDGRSISAGIEILAKLDETGVAALANYPEDVQMLFEQGDANAPSPAQAGRKLQLTLNDDQVVYVDLIESAALDVFLAQLPLTLHVTDYASREKHAALPFTIEDSDLHNVLQPYEIGDFSYYPPTSTLAAFYAHDGNIISAGMEKLGTLDADAIAALAAVDGAVDITIELVD